MNAKPKAISPSNADGRVEPAVFYKPQEVADLLRCSITNVYALMRSGKLARLRVGAGQAGFRVKGSDLLSFIEGNTSGGPQPQMTFKYLRMGDKK